MSYAKQLTNMAWASEQSLAQLVGEQEAQNERTGALDALEEEWEEAKADGVIDARELSSLLSRSQAAGTEALTDELVRLTEATGVQDQSKLIEAETLLRDSLKQARLSSGQGEAKRQLLLQLGMSEMKSLYESASAASRTEHQTYMTVIGNLKA